MDSKKAFVLASFAVLALWPLASGAYGIDAAARRYFSKPARNLSLGEAAMIAGLLKAPSKYSPLSNPSIARARARLVLSTDFPFRDASIEHLVEVVRIGVHENGLARPARV